jgi:hypothetical protein
MKRVAWIMCVCSVSVVAGSEARAFHLGRRGGIGSIGISPVQGMAMMYQAMFQYNLGSAIAARNSQLAYSRYFDDRRTHAICESSVRLVRQYPSREV